jgi:hypothetical protein
MQFQSTLHTLHIRSPVNEPSHAPAGLLAESLARRKEVDSQVVGVVVRLWQHHIFDSVYGKWHWLTVDRAQHYLSVHVYLDHVREGVVWVLLLLVLFKCSRVQ